MNMLSAMITMTDAAAKRAKSLIDRSDGEVLGLKVGVKTGGCSGLMYEIDYARSKSPLDQVVEEKGVKVFIDPTAMMYLIGSEMDYQEDKFQGGFVFNNPNAAAQCGCGESFTIDRDELIEMKQNEDA
jgi:iron-sulfur cluster assembly protein